MPSEGKGHTFESCRVRPIHDFFRHRMMPLRFWSATSRDNYLIAQAAAAEFATSRHVGLPICTGSPEAPPAPPLGDGGVDWWVPTTARRSPIVLPNGRSGASLSLLRALPHELDE